MTRFRSLRDFQDEALGLGLFDDVEGLGSELDFVTGFNKPLPKPGLYPVTGSVPPIPVTGANPTQADVFGFPAKGPALMIPPAPVHTAMTLEEAIAAGEYSPPVPIVAPAAPQAPVALATLQPVVLPVATSSGAPWFVHPAFIAAVTALSLLVMFLPRGDRR